MLAVYNAESAGAAGAPTGQTYRSQSRWDLGASIFLVCDRATSIFMAGWDETNGREIRGSQEFFYATNYGCEAVPFGAKRGDSSDHHA